MTHPDPTDLVAALEKCRRWIHGGHEENVVEAIDAALAAYRAQPRSDRVAGAELLSELKQTLDENLPRGSCCRKAAEDMRERAAKVARRHTYGDYSNTAACIEDEIRALPVEEK